MYLDLDTENMLKVFISFQEKINKEKTAASKMLTAVLFYWNYFLMSVILK